MTNNGQNGNGAPVYATPKGIQNGSLRTGPKNVLQRIAGTKPVLGLPEAERIFDDLAGSGVSGEAAIPAAITATARLFGADVVVEAEAAAKVSEMEAAAYAAEDARAEGCVLVSLAMLAGAASSTWPGASAKPRRKSAAGRRLPPARCNSVSTSTPSPVQAWAMVSGSRGASGRSMTTTRSMPYFLANSKSRWSCVGTDMTAPVP